MYKNSKNKLANRVLALAAILFIGGSCLVAQVPIPPPGPNTPPPPLNQTVPPPPTPNPGPMPPPPNPQTPQGWGAPGMLVSPPTQDWMNQGTINVMATGYDAESVLVQIPLVVSYSFNGVNYNVTVLNSWNPFTQSWNIGVDVPAQPTTYGFNGFTYNYCVSLPSGTFYFNL